MFPKTVALIFIMSIIFISFFVLIRQLSENTKSILVVASHPDDETIGAGIKMIRSMKKGEKVYVVYITDGAPGCEECDCFSWGDFKTCKEYRLQREKETKYALSLANISSGNLIFLRNDDQFLKFYRSNPDETLIQIKNIISNLTDILNRVKPAEVYITAYEGGHCDHDLSHFIAVQAFIKSNIANSTKVYEFPEYCDDVRQEFIPQNNSQEAAYGHAVISLDYSQDELNLRNRMLLAYTSQNEYLKKTNNGKTLVDLFGKPDKFRLLPPYDYSNPPRKDIDKNQLVEPPSCNVTYAEFAKIVSQI